MACNKKKLSLAMNIKKQDGTDLTIKFGSRATVEDILIVLSEEEPREITSIDFGQLTVAGVSSTSSYVTGRNSNAKTAGKKASGRGLLAFFEK